MSSTAKLSPQQQSVIDQLVAMGIERAQARRAVVDGNQSEVQGALDYVFNPPAVAQPVAQPVASNTQAQAASRSASNAASTNRMPQLLEAAQRSAAPHNTPTGKPAAAAAPPPSIKNTEDMELEAALALSLQESATPSALSLPPSSLPGSVSADEQAAQAAIMASILSSSNQREDGVWVDPANPHQRTRRPGVPTGLKNTGNICYFNSLMQVYFHLRPTLLRAVMAVRPPQPPPQPSSQPGPIQMTTSGSVQTVTHSAGVQIMTVNGRSINVPAGSSVIMNENGVFVDGKPFNIDAQSSASASSSQSATPSPSVAFMLSLQRLFAGLHLSQRRYLDPIATVNALFAASGHSATEQRMQHDASEFHDLIVETMHQALAAPTDPSPVSSTVTSPSSAKSSLSLSSASASSTFSASASPQPANSVVRDMFFARALQEVRYTDEKGAQQTLQSNSQHGPLILHIAGGSLMSALDEYTHTTLDYRASASAAPTPATSSLWFERLPTVLCFQLQRVGYDSVRKEAVKDNRLFRLDERIWMDRYCVQRREESEAKRAEAGGWKEQRAKVEAEMKRLTDYNDSGIALNAALDASAHYLASLPPTTQAPAPLPAVAAYLSTLSGALTASLAQLSAERARLSSLIDTAYDALRSDESEYRLLAVLVHDGKEAGTGHYWSYIRRTRAEEEESKSGGGGAAGRFWKYNDAVVSAVDDATMWRESEGGQPNTAASAYFLVYTKRTEAEAADVDVDTLITQALREEVRKENEKLRVETEEWDVKEESKAVEAEADKARKRYAEGEAQLKKLDASSERKEAAAEEGVDWRLFSFPAFLKLHPSASELLSNQLPQNQLLEDAMREVQCAAGLVGRVRERAIALLMKDGVYTASLASQRLTEADVRLVEDRRREWDEYVAVSSSEVRGLMRLTESSTNVKAALLSLLRAHSRWNALSAATSADRYAAKQRELSLYLQLATYLLYMSAKLRLRSSASASCYSDLQLVSGVTAVFPGVRAFYQQEVVLLASERDGDERMEAVVHDAVAADMLDEDDGKAGGQSARLDALLARLEADESCKVSEAAEAEEGRAIKREGLFALHSRLCSLVGVKLKQSLGRVKALMAGSGEMEEEKEEEVAEVVAWMVAGGAAEQPQQLQPKQQEEKEAAAAVDAEMKKADDSSEKHIGSGAADARTVTAMDDST